MQRMSRMQRILVAYLLYELQKPRIMQRLTRQYVGGGGLAKSSDVDHGATQGLTDDDHTQYYNQARGDARYLTLSGGIMTGDLDITGQRLKLAADLFLKSYSATVAEIVNSANILKGLRVSSAYFSSIQPQGTAGHIKAPYGNNNWLKFWAGLNGVATQVGIIMSHVTAPYFEISRAGDITMLDQKMFQLGSYTDAQRPAAGTAGRVIFNTDDGMPNYDDGANWRDVNGNVT